MIKVKNKMFKLYLISIFLMLVLSWFFVDICYWLELKMSVSYLDSVSMLISTVSFFFLFLSFYVLWLRMGIKRVWLREILLHIGMIPIVVFITSLFFSFFLDAKIKNHYNKFQHLLIQSTKWSKHFSEEKFNIIKIGQTKKEVFQILGEPLSEFSKDNITRLTYSQMGKYNSIAKKGYHSRVVVLDGQDKVRYVLKGYLTGEESYHVFPSKSVPQVKGSKGKFYVFYRLLTDIFS